ncbi:hypothetical protein ABGB14_33885 [Nonomuraea sp. B10E15]|uniref:hypothetical protein n=1 Tax=Nonomuraea sp. B10E15 TaxID=3153560 RepID=UPI00325E17DE
MGVVVPPAVEGMLSMISPGYTVNEDDMRSESTAARTVAAQALPATMRAETAVRGAQEHYGGGSGTALQAHWDRTGLSGGHLDQAATAARLAPVGLEGAANVVSGMKLATAVQAAAAAADVAKLLAFGGAAGATYATARVLAARAAAAKIRREGVQGTGNVLGQLLRRRVTEPMRRILDNLRRPGGPGGTPALAGTGGRNVPMRPTSVSGSGTGDNRTASMLGRRRSSDSNDNNSNNNNSNNNNNNNNNKPPLNQQNRNEHKKGASKSKRDKHQNAARHGGRRRIPENPNKKKKKK